MRSDGAEARPAASATVHKSADWLTNGERAAFCSYSTSRVSQLPAPAAVNGRAVLGLGGSRVTVQAAMVWLSLLAG